MRKAFDWKRSRISLLEVEAIPQSLFQVQIDLSIVLYTRSLFLVKSYDLRPSSQYILVRVSPSFFHFAKMCLCQKSPVKLQPEILDFFFLGELHVVYMDWGGGGVHI
jgi:hypothetical protein